MELEIEADLSFDSPFGPGYLRVDDDAVVVGVAGLIAALRLGVWYARNPVIPSSRMLASALGRPVYLKVGALPRVRIRRRPTSPPQTRVGGAQGSAT